MNKNRYIWGDTSHTSTGIMKTSFNIHFLGAAGTVTGSKFLLELPEKKILIDCGMFQGVKNLRQMNWQPLPVNVREIDLVLLTHGHLDHIGFLPRLFKNGYNGPVWGTSPTLDIAEIILRDSAKIQEEDAERANKEKFTKHSPAEPLYNTSDVEQTVARFRAQKEGDWIDISKSIRVRFRYNGHILGASFIELEAAGKRFVFSGDIGRNGDPVLRDPEKPDRADVLLLESTYGNRLHAEEDSEEKLLRIIRETIEKKGTLIIPSFVVERAQLLMYYIWKLKEQKNIPVTLPVCLDSPMGIDVLKQFITHHRWHKLTLEECGEMCEGVQLIRSFNETRELMKDPQPKIVIAGSGMVTGGRVLSWLQNYIGRPETTVLFAGYQAEGTRGRQILEGAGEIKFYGKYHPIRARIEMLQGLSGHADQSELLEWVSELREAPEQIFIVHGEARSSDMLRLKLKELYGWDAVVPSHANVFSNK